MRDRRPDLQEHPARAHAPPPRLPARRQRFSWRGAALGGGLALALLAILALWMGWPRAAAPGVPAPTVVPQPTTVATLSSRSPERATTAPAAAPTPRAALAPALSRGEREEEAVPTPAAAPARPAVSQAGSAQPAGTTVA